MRHFLKTSLLIVSLGLGVTLFAHAQAPQTPQAAAPATAPHHEPNPAHQAKALAKKLGLSADQTAQVTPILADRDQRVQALMSNTALDPKSMRQQRRAIAMDTDQKLNAILTPAQQQQYATLKAERHHQGQPAPTAPPAASL
jgi:Spy/CpxP family protein refolding chaperone